MGLFSRLAFELSGAVYDAKRSRANLYLKMELFVSNYPGAVGSTAIPIMNASKSSKYFVNYYVRDVYEKHTNFNWFHDLPGALEYSEKSRAELGLQRKHFEITTKKLAVIGPHELPWGKDDRFF